MGLFYSYRHKEHTLYFLCLLHQETHCLGSIKTDSRMA